MKLYFIRKWKGLNQTLMSYKPRDWLTSFWVLRDLSCLMLGLRMSFWLRGLRGQCTWNWAIWKASFTLWTRTVFILCTAEVGVEATLLRTLCGQTDSRRCRTCWEGFWRGQRIILEQYRENDGMIFIWWKFPDQIWLIYKSKVYFWIS